MPKLHRLTQTFSFAVVLLLLLTSSCVQPAAQEQPTPTPVPTIAMLNNPTYVTARGDVIEVVKFTGRVTPADEVELYFRLAGRVKQVYVKEGEPVEASQLLADLEGVDELQRKMSLGELHLERAQANATIAQLNYDLFVETTPTYTQGYEKRLAIQAQQLNLAKIALRESELGLDELKDAVEQTRLLAPADGEITQLNVVVGHEVQAFKPVGKVADLSQLEVSADLVGDTVRKLEKGMPVVISTGSGIREEMAGAIYRLPSTGLTADSNQDARLRIAIVGRVEDAGYALDDLVQVNVLLNKSENTLWLPPQAIRVFEGRRFVVIQEGSLQRRIDVKLGLLSEDRVEILEGLIEGQVVISP